MESLSGDLGSALPSPPPVRKTNAQKRWTVNGSIAPEASSAYYYVDTTETNAPLFQQLQEPHTYLLMHGARGSGKTTRTFQLADQLALVGYQCILVSLQEGIPLERPEEFWEAFGSRIHRELNPSKDRMISSAASFVKFFEPMAQAPEQQQQQKFILMVDEFDLLWRASDAVRNELLDTLRGIRQAAQTSSKATRLHAFLGVGPFSILSLSGQTSSPFNVSDAWCVPRFTRRQVENLFLDYGQNSGVRLDGRIARHIHHLTAGHAGLVSFCGKQLSASLAVGRARVGYNDWVKYAQEDLISQLNLGWPTMGALVREILKDDEKIKHAREFLLARFLYRNHYIRQPQQQRRDEAEGNESEDSEEEEEDENKAKEDHGDDAEIDEPNIADEGLTAVTPDGEQEAAYCGFLAKEGILRTIDNQGTKFVLSSFLVRNLVTSAIRSSMSSISYPFGDPPFADAGRCALDVPRLVITCLRAMEEKTMRSAPHKSFKIARSRGCPLQTVPSEAVYQDQLYYALRSWLSANFSYRIITQVNPALDIPGLNIHNRERCDLTISREHLWKCTIEISASPKPSELREHIQRSPRYKSALAAQEGWALNFDIHRGSDATNRTLLAWPREAEDGIGVMHVFHDADWNSAWVYWRMTVNGGTLPDLQHEVVNLRRGL